jgi:hypothetical protein
VYNDDYEVSNISKKDKKFKKKRDFSRYKKSKYVKTERGVSQLDEIEMLKIQNLLLCNVCNNVYHNSLKECPKCDN